MWTGTQWGRPHTCMHTLTHVLPDTVYWNAIMRSSDATRGALFARMPTVLFLLACVALRATSALDRLVVDLEEEKTEGVTSPSIADPIKDMIEKNKQRKERKWWQILNLLIILVRFFWRRPLRIRHGIKNSLAMPASLGILLMVSNSSM